MEIPEKVFIQFWYDKDGKNVGPDMVWCRQRENKSDIEYVQVRRNTETTSYMLDIYREDGSSKRVVAASVRKMNDTKRAVPNHLPIYVYRLIFEGKLSRLKGD